MCVLQKKLKQNAVPSAYLKEYIKESYITSPIGSTLIAICDITQ